MTEQILIDPLKAHSHNIKKPLEKRLAREQRLEEHNLWYYPKDRKIVMNEWGAVINNQVENAKREEEEAQR